jgi:hypothetical protein
MYWDLLLEQCGLRVCGACELGEHNLCRKQFIGGQKCDCRTCYAERPAPQKEGA